MNTVLHNSEYSIYPGHYVPMLNEEEISDLFFECRIDDIRMTESEAHGISLVNYDSCMLDN